MNRLAIGVPFYGRDIRSGHPETYADLLPLLEKLHPIPTAEEGEGAENAASVRAAVKARDEVDLVGYQYYNGPEMMRRKAALAVREGVHVMVWELGQDVSPPSHPAGLLAALGKGLRNAEEEIEANLKDEL